MTVIGIVGAEQAKFSPRAEESARAFIRALILQRRPTLVVSGACHLGGADVYAVEEAQALHVETKEFPPATHSWAEGYKPRNIQIAQASHELYCITVDKLPGTFKGPNYGTCYHCSQRSHIKSGGCWTVHYGRTRKKEYGIVCIAQDTGLITVESASLLVLPSLHEIGAK